MMAWRGRGLPYLPSPINDLTQQELVLVKTEEFNDRKPNVKIDAILDSARFKYAELPKVTQEKGESQSVVDYIFRVQTNQKYSYI